MVEMIIAGLAVDEESQVPVLILKDKAEEEIVLPIWIGAMEAMAISLAMNNVELPRPMTHDLLLNMLESLDGHLRSVEIVRLDNGTFFAELDAVQYIADTQRPLRVDCRPSDAIALALRADVPVRVAPEVIEAGAAKDPSRGIPEDAEGPEKWTELLDSLSDEDTKYKM